MEGGNVLFLVYKIIFLHKLICHQITLHVMIFKYISYYLYFYSHNTNKSCGIH